MLANAQHVRNVPGRKSDVNDAMWLADLLAHGLVRGGFVPPEHFTRRDKKRAARRQQRRLEDLGFTVELRPTTAGVSIQGTVAPRSP